MSRFSKKKTKKILCCHFCDILDIIAYNVSDLCIETSQRKIYVNISKYFSLLIQLRNLKKKAPRTPAKTNIYDNDFVP